MKNILATVVVGLALFLSSSFSYAGSAYIPAWQANPTYSAFFGLQISNITNAPQTVSYILYDANGNIAHQGSQVVGARQTWLLNLTDTTLKLGFGEIKGEGGLVAHAYVHFTPPGPILSIPINGGAPF